MRNVGGEFNPGDMCTKPASIEQMLDRHLRYVGCHCVQSGGPPKWRRPKGADMKGSYPLCDNPVACAGTGNIVDIRVDHIIGIEPCCGSRLYL